MIFCKNLKPSHFKSDVLVFNLNKLYKKTKVELNIVENHHSWIPRKIKVSNSCKVPPKSHSINLKINNIFVFVEHCFYIYKMFCFILTICISPLLRILFPSTLTMGLDPHLNKPKSGCAQSNSRFRGSDVQQQS